jgi:hypothetical protein
VIDGPLHINHDERGIWWQGTGQAANHAVIIRGARTGGRRGAPGPGTPDDTLCGRQASRRVSTRHARVRAPLATSAACILNKSRGSQMDIPAATTLQAAPKRSDTGLAFA